jgi:hypothetical protein
MEGGCEMSQKQSVEDSQAFRAMRERLLRLEEKYKQEHFINSRTLPFMAPYFTSSSSAGL